MDCPFCENTLISFEEHQLHLDRCPEGLGIWFDGGELEAYRKKHPDAEKLLKEETHQFQSLPGEVVKDWPRCRRTTLEAGRLYDLKVHHCITCHGVFLCQKTTISHHPKNRMDWKYQRELKLAHRSSSSSSLHFDKRGNQAQRGL